MMNDKTTPKAILERVNRTRAQARACEVPTTSTRVFVDWEAERRADRIADPWIRGSQAAWEASRPRPWIRWVDLFPAGARDLLAGVRRQRIELEAARIEARYERLAREAAMSQEEHDRRRHRREIDRASWARKRLRLYGNKTREQLAAEREEQKRLTRTPEQQQRHDAYVARRDARMANGNH